MVNEQSMVELPGMNYLIEDLYKECEFNAYKGICWTNFETKFREEYSRFYSIDHINRLIENFRTYPGRFGFSKYKVVRLRKQTLNDPGTARGFKLIDPEKCHEYITGNLKLDSEWDYDN